MGGWTSRSPRWWPRRTRSPRPGPAPPRPRPWPISSRAVTRPRSASWCRTCPGCCRNGGWGSASARSARCPTRPQTPASPSPRSMRRSAGWRPPPGPAPPRRAAPSSPRSWAARPPTSSGSWSSSSPATCARAPSTAWCSPRSRRRMPCPTPSSAGPSCSPAPPPRWPAWRRAAAPRRSSRSVWWSGARCGRCWPPPPRPPARRSSAVGGGDLLVDGKLDGIRIQVHRRGDEVAVYTRSLDDITERVPEVVEAVARAARRRPGARRRGHRSARRRAAGALPGHRVAHRQLRRRRRPARAGAAHAVLLRRAPPRRRRPARRDRSGAPRRPRRPSPPQPGRSRGCSPTTRGAARGVLRRRASPPATRASWSRRADARTTPAAAAAAGVKVKPVHTLDLVVLAVEWGSRPAQGLAVATSTSAPVTRRPAGSSCSARRSRA